MSLEVKIEIRSTVTKEPSILADGNTHSFIVYVQGLNGNHIEHFIKEVVFYLPPNAPNSKLVRNKPPYLISGSTNASFRLSIDLFLHASENFNKLRYSYFVLVPDKPVEKAVCVKTLTFLNAPKDFQERLLLGGAEAVNHEKKPKTVLADAKCKSEPVEEIENQNVKIKEETSDQVPNSDVQTGDVTEHNSSMVIESIHSFDDLLKENRILKESAETLKRTFSDQERELATYTERFSLVQKNASAIITELNQLKEKSETTESEIANLKSSLQMVTYDLLQYKNSSNPNNEAKKDPEIPFITI